MANYNFKNGSINSSATRYITSSKKGAGKCISASALSLVFAFASISAHATFFSSDYQDIHTFTQVTLTAAKAEVFVDFGPTPPRALKPVEYRSQNKADPFVAKSWVEKSVVGNECLSVEKPNQEGVEMLQSFELESLSMVGSFEQGEQIWALVKDPAGGIHRVTEGNYLGRDFGRVVAVSSSAITLKETIHNGVNGYIRCDNTLHLQEPR